MSKLTEKQRLFCLEYMKDLNATQAAIRAGYSENQTPPTRGYYTYALLNKINDTVFYIGKGKGNRVYHHAKTKNKTNQCKMDVINSIHDQNLEVHHLILSTHKDETEAYTNEDNLIETIGYNNLTNKKANHGARRTSVAFLDPVGNDFKLWARDALEKIKPYIDTGRITFLGKHSEVTEARLISFLSEVANG